jgi:hypothetical protein
MELNIKVKKRLERLIAKTYREVWYHMNTKSMIWMLLDLNSSKMVAKVKTSPYIPVSHIQFDMYHDRDLLVYKLIPLFINRSNDNASIVIDQPRKEQ